MLFKTILVTLLLAYGTVIAAPVHKCVSAQGKLEYSDGSCKGEKIETPIKNNPSNLNLPKQKTGKESDEDSPKKERKFPIPT
jgi:hypothetical protein